MLPHIEQPILQIGAARIEAFHLLVLAGALTGYRLALRRAVAAGLPRADVASVLGLTILWGFVASHVFEVLAYHPTTLSDDPLELPPTIPVVPVARRSPL